MPEHRSTDAARVVDPYLPSSGDAGYAVDRYDLDLDYRIATNRLTGRAVITATAVDDLDRFSLDLAGLTVDRVTVDSIAPRKMTTTARKLRIVLAERIPSGTAFTVVVKYHGAPRPIRGQWGEVGWEELADGVLVASQPDGASSWFPCNDHPSDKALYDIAVTCDAGYTVVANGRLVDKTPVGSRIRWQWRVPEPMATYLATVQIGRYRSFTLPASVPVTVYAPLALRANAERDLGRVPAMIDVFSELFGPYPFGGYGVIVTSDVLEIPLEAHNLAIFGRNHIDGVHGSDRLIAHELAHQWFGNSLTASLWRDIWLHEGFACYAEWLWAERSGGPSAHENARRHRLRLASEPQDIAIGDPGVGRMFDDRVYKRGALTLHAVRGAIGDVAFFAGLRTLSQRHRFGHISRDDVVDAFSTAADASVIRALLGRWLDEKPLPAVA